MAWMPAVTAANRRQTLLAQEQKEEEDMTEYTQDDLENDWEFKIVRSDTGAFRRPEVLNKLLEEEARAGWVMLEKFDDSRIRFKRPRSARSRDAFLPPDVDPYRTQYGAPASRRVALMAVVLGLVFVLGLVSFFLMDRMGAPAGTTTTPALIPLVLIILGFVVMILKLRSR